MGLNGKNGNLKKLFALSRRFSGIVHEKRLGGGEFEFGFGFGFGFGGRVVGLWVLGF